MSYEIVGASASVGAGGLRELVAQRVRAHGGWCMVPSAFLTEVVSAAGCDWLCIDTQHGLIDDAHMRVMVQAAAIRRTPTVVRVPWNEPAAIMRALDAGADGVIVPMVNSVEEAIAAASATRYPPAGFRSWGPLRSGMAQPGFDPELGNRQTVCLVMIETIEAFQRLEGILDVPGVDGVFVGPNDLAISHSGSNAEAARSPRDVEMIERIAAACEERGLAAGISCSDAAEAQRWQRVGYTLLGLPSDAGLLGDALAGVLAHARAKDTQA
jgi:4-hydroxy-2-oxoheptanedioate aldolase